MRLALSRNRPIRHSVMDDKDEIKTAVTELDQYFEFYKYIAMSTFQFSKPGTRACCNIDTYVFSSMQNTFLSLIREHDVQLISATEHIDLDTPHGELNALMMMAFNQYYVSDVKYKQKIKYYNAREHGIFVGGTPPFGYSRDVDDLTPVPEEVAVLKDIFKRFLSGKLTMEIAASLNQKGHKTRRGSNFSAQSVKAILENPIYAGFIAGNPDEDGSRPLVKGQHQAIIPRRKWLEVQKTLTRRKEVREASKADPKILHTYNTNKYEALLKGLAYCGTTGYMLSPCRQGNSTYYVSSRSLKEGASYSGPIKRINQRQFETTIINLLQDVGKSPEIIRLTIRKMNQSKEPKLRKLRSLRAEKVSARTKANKAVNNFKNFLETADDPDVGKEFQEDLKAKIQELRLLDSEILELEHKIELLNTEIYDPQTVIDTLSSLNSALDPLPFKKQHELMSLLIDRIEIFPWDYKRLKQQPPEQIVDAKLRTKAYRIKVELFVSLELSATYELPKKSSQFSKNGRADRI